MSNMPTRKKIAKRKRRSVQRMVTKIRCGQPYEWVPEALEKFAERQGVTRSYACCVLLDRGLKRSLVDFRVLRMFTKHLREEVFEVPPFSLSAEHADLYERIGVAVTELQGRHGQRAQDAMQKLALAGLDGSARGLGAWRWGEKTGNGVLMHFSTPKSLPKEALHDACDCAADDMTISDVIRAIWASELEAEKLAPKKWSDRWLVANGIFFKSCEVL